MGERERNIPPPIYHNNDPDGIVELWKEMVDIVSEDQKAHLTAFRNIVDPDLTPEQFIDLMLASLGNPFKNIPLTILQKRRLIKLLVPIYKQKALGRGIENVVRFMTGLEIQVLDPHADYRAGWQVGLSEVGESLYVGGTRFYCNLLSNSEDFDSSSWTVTSATATLSDEVGPSPWGRPSYELDFSAPGATISQTVTPSRIQNQPFTGAVWLRASDPTTLQARIEADENSLDGTTTNLDVTEEWQRFSFEHLTYSDESGDIVFSLSSTAGTANEVFIWGAGLYRTTQAQPYVRTFFDGADCSHPGRWAYHFFIVLAAEITPEQEEIIRFIADYMKTEHTHYSFITPDSEEFIDHWEVGISLVGVNNYVHE